MNLEECTLSIILVNLAVVGHQKHSKISSAKVYSKQNISGDIHPNQWIEAILNHTLDIM